MSERQTYRAFLSYSHRDKRKAQRWHTRLESFRIDPGLINRDTPLGPVPPSLSPIFRDRLDFPVGVELTKATLDALEQSAALILVATPNAAASEYVNEEVRVFRHAHKDRRPVIAIFDAPRGASLQDCLPPAMRFALDNSGAVSSIPNNPLVADPRAGAEGVAQASAKVVARLLGVEPKDILPRIEAQLRSEKETRAALAATRRQLKAEAEKTRSVVTQGLDSLKELFASGGRALSEIRGFLRAHVPEIDAIPDEQLPRVVQRLIDDLSKPGANPNDFAGGIRQALADAQAKVGALAFGEAARLLKAELARTSDLARGRAALLAESGRVARLQLHYREAADFYTQARHTIASADSVAVWRYESDAAEALYDQGNEFGDNAALTEAIQRYRTALPLVPRDRSPDDWATTQMALGNALRVLGGRETDTTHLTEAAAAFRAAMEVRTRAANPQGWAAAQVGIGNALWTLGERESGTARLEESVTAYRAALEERTRARVPPDWAQSQYNLANALATLAERTGDRARMTEAIASMRNAAAVYREGNNTYWGPIAERRVTEMEATLAKMPR